MAPASQAILFCDGADVMDWLSSQAVDMRLDDNNLATGQVIRCVVDALTGATTLQITALRVPLIKGTVLQFNGGGMSETVEDRKSVV